MRRAPSLRGSGRDQIVVALRGWRRTACAGGDLATLLPPTTSAAGAGTTGECTATEGVLLLSVPVAAVTRGCGALDSGVGRGSFPGSFVWSNPTTPAAPLPRSKLPTAASAAASAAAAAAAARLADSRQSPCFK